MKLLFGWGLAANPSRMQPLVVWWESDWSYLKLVDLANVACDTLPELDTLIQRAKKRLQRKPDLIQAFTRDAGYEV